MEASAGEYGRAEDKERWKFAEDRLMISIGGLLSCCRNYCERCCFAPALTSTARWSPQRQTKKTAPESLGVASTAAVQPGEGERGGAVGGKNQAAQRPRDEGGSKTEGADETTSDGVALLVGEGKQRRREQRAGPQSETDHQQGEGKGERENRVGSGIAYSG